MCASGWNSLLAFRLQALHVQIQKYWFTHSYGMLAIHLAAGVASSSMPLSSWWWWWWVYANSVTVSVSGPHRNPHSHPETTELAETAQLGCGDKYSTWLVIFPIFSISSISNLFSLCLHNASHSMVLCASFLIPDLVCCCSKYFPHFSVNEPVVSESLSVNINITIFIYSVITCGLAIGHILGLMKFKEQKRNLQYFHGCCQTEMEILQWSEWLLCQYLEVTCTVCG